MIKIKNPLFAVFLVFFLLVSAFLGYSLSYRNLILPNISVSGVEIGGLSKEVAEMKIEKAFEDSPNQVSVTRMDGAEVGSLEKIEIKRDYKWVADQSLKIGRERNIFKNIKTRVELVFKPLELSLPLIFDEASLEDALEEVALKVEEAPKRPTIIKEGEKYVFVKGVNGVALNRDMARAKIREKLALPGNQSVILPLEEIKMEENQELVAKALDNLNSWGEQPLLIKYKDFNLNLELDRIAPLFGLINDLLDLDEFKELVTELAEKVETEPKDAVFEFDEGKVQEFKAEVVGVIIDIPKLEKVLEQALKKDAERTVEIPVILNYPKVRTGDINNLGIKELLGVGKSSFSHSIPGRVFNVNLASSRINGVVVAPGEEFSFNKAVGDINRQTGYQTAYVISGGKTVLGDGGGVCQVSTTVFRAALNSGFPITERRAHAYRVGYYEQDSLPGIDATIYSPTTDFKFLNDTGHHILIQIKVDTKNLTMKVEVYGTSDGRVASISKPVVFGQVAAPATVYVDDPNLPKGTKKQIDWSAPGAKVNFDYKVVRNGETLFEKKFISNYQPWRAVYLVGTGN